MSLNGKWVTANDTERSSELWAWGEWEAESTARELSRPGGDPRFRTISGLRTTCPSRVTRVCITPIRSFSASDSCARTAASRAEGIRA